MNISSLLAQALAGLDTAGTLFLVGAGLTLVFGALRIVNVAHGSLYMYGAYVGTGILGAEGILHNFLLALCAGTAVAGLLGIAIERLVLRRLYERDPVAQLLATFALLYILDDLAQVIWGAGTRSATLPGLLSGSVHIADRIYPIYGLFAIGIAGIVGAGLWALLRATRFGWRIRAALNDPELLLCTGTNVPLLRAGVLGLGAALAGLAGVVGAASQAVGPGIDASILIDAFVVAIIGGMGSIGGAAIASVLLGLVQSFGVAYAPQVVPESLFLVMIIVLVVRPQGLLGARGGAQ
jgi:branched-chain amino acid transport system permease protein